MKNNKNTSEDRTLIYEGIAESFIQNPFAFMFGAHFMQSLLRAPEQGEDAEFEKWMEENSNLPDAVEQMKDQMGSKKLSADEIRKKGIDFVGKEEKETMAKAMNDLPPELKKKFESRMTEKSIKSFARFQDSAKASLRSTNEATKKLEKELTKVSETLKNSPLEELLPQDVAKQALGQLNKQIGVYQKTIVQKITTFQETLKDNIQKTNNKKLMGKLDLNPFSLDEVLGSSLHEAEENKQSPEKYQKSAKFVMEMMTNTFDEYVTAQEKGIKELMKGLNGLKALLGADALGLGEMGTKWEQEVTKIAKMWLSETQEVALEILDSMEKRLEFKLKQKMKQSGGEGDKEKINESRRAHKFYESFGDFS